MFFKRIFKTKNNGPYRTNAKDKVRTHTPEIFKVDNQYIAKYNGGRYLFDKKADQREFLWNYEFVNCGSWYGQNGRFVEKSKILKKALMRFVEKEDEIERAEKVEKLFMSKDNQLTEVKNEI